MLRMIVNVFVTVLFFAIIFTEVSGICWEKFRFLNTVGSKCDMKRNDYYRMRPKMVDKIIVGEYNFNEIYSPLIASRYAEYWMIDANMRNRFW